MRNKTTLFLLLSIIITGLCVLYIKIINDYSVVCDNYYKFILEDGSGTLCQVDTLVSGNIEIPSEVVYLGKSHFIEAIDDYSFYYCNNLISVTIPSSIKYIGNGAFLSCQSLKSVIIYSPSNTYLGVSAFRSCYELEKVTIPKQLIIEPYTFSYCTKLNNVTIPNSVT